MRDIEPRVVQAGACSLGGWLVRGLASLGASGLLMAAAWAQAPVPPPAPTPGLIPVPPSGPATMLESPRQYGPIRRAMQHVSATLHDQFVGYPDQFVEPPLGASVAAGNQIMRAKADTHRFFLYRSDFVVGTDQFSPTGAARINLMMQRLPGWLGALGIEWTPDQPELAETRRLAVVAALQKAGMPVIPERVVIAPSPYPGALGADAANYYDVMITRDAAAPSAYSLTPAVSVMTGTGGGGGGGTP